MAKSKEFILRFIDHCGGEVDSYPILEAFASITTAHALVDDGMLERIQVQGGLDHYRITEAGRRELQQLTAADRPE